MSLNLTETVPPAINELASCIDCATPLRGHDRCPACDRGYETSDGITSAIGPLQGAIASSRSFTTVQVGSAFASGNGYS